MCGINNVVMVAPRISLVRNNENCADEILYGDECMRAWHISFMRLIKYNTLCVIQFKLNGSGTATGQMQYEVMGFFNSIT